MPIKTNCKVCKKEISYKPSAYKRVKNHTCSRKCLGKLKSILNLGKSNPNSKYNNDTEFFKNINTEEKAYILGFIASDGHISRGSVTIEIHKKDVDVLKQIQNAVNKKIPIKTRYLKNQVSYRICSINMCSDICNHLGIKPGKKSKTVKFPNIAEDLKRHFIRGFFDGDGSISSPHTEKYAEALYSPECNIASNSIEMLKFINSVIKVQGVLDLTNNQLRWNGLSCLDFLGEIYEDSRIKLRRKYDLYEEICSWEPSVSYHRSFKNEYFRFSKTDKLAIKPKKVRVSDSGYDLSIIKKVKDLYPGTSMYDTGIKVKPMFGYYFIAVPRSSLSKSGYILTNSIGIIDRSYIGSIKVCLTKVDPNAPDIEYPFRCIQIIPKKIQHFTFVEVDDFNNESSRGSGGFGSTGV